MAESLASNCSNCGRPYRKDILLQCPGCASREEETAISRRSKASTSASWQPRVVAEESTEVERLLLEIVKSTSKTTHAVRAFVLFFFIQLTATTLAGLFIIWSNPFSIEPNRFLFSVGVLIYMGGIAWSGKAGWDELSQSE